MDNYDLVLGMKCFKQLVALVLPHENVVVILDFKCPWVMRGKRKNRVATKFLLAIQFSKGVYEEAHILASIKVDKDKLESWDSNASDRHAIELKRRHTSRLLKKLPSKWEVDDHIKLVSDAQPPACTLNQMSTNQSPFEIIQQSLTQLRINEKIDKSESMTSAILI